MRQSRLVRHLLTGPRAVNRAFSASSLKAIEQATQAGEQRHRGQIRFAVEAALPLTAIRAGQTPRQRALDVFSQLRIWDTEHNSGVLIYLLLADRAVEIIADRGINARIPPTRWQAICAAMQTEFRQQHFEAGVIAGIQAVAAHLAEHFPADGTQANELPDAPVVLGGDYS